MHSIKILQVNKLYYPHIGGIEKHLYLLCNELAHHSQFDVTALVCNTRFRTEFENSSNFRLVRAASLGTFLGMPYAFSLPLWLRHLKADVLHFHHPFPPGEMSFLLARPGGKVVVSWHSDIVRLKQAMKLYRPFLFRFLEKADRILVASPHYLETSSYLGTFKDKCKIIPYGIDIRQFQLTSKIKAEAAALREQYGPRIVLFIGRLVYYKGLEYLITAMRDIDAKLLIIGEGALESELNALIINLGLREKIYILKSVEEERLASYYHACDLFVLPSTEISEAFGIVQLEAMASGKPVVSTNLPTGVPFVNKHQKTGLLVPPKNPSALAQAINILLNNPGLREEYGVYAKKRVESEFTKEATAAKVMAVYNELVNLS